MFTVGESRLSTLTLHLFGAPRAEIDGKPVVTDTRKAIALLAYLAVTRQPQTRDALATLFWPELDQTHARAALRRTLSALNAAAALPWLHVEREQVTLAVDGDFDCDVHRFERCVAGCLPDGAVAADRCRPLLEEAAQLYHGDFLEGFTLRDSAAFDDWQFFRAEGYRTMLAKVLEALVRCAIQEHDWPNAIAHARRRLTIDPLHEPAHRQLMQLYSWNDQRAAALRQYQECRRILEDELGVPPLPETDTLHAAILAHDTSPPKAAPVTPAAVTVALPQPALVGREAEWSALQTACQMAGVHGRLIVVEGEAGIGKTALATAFAAGYAQQGAAVLTVTCYEGEASLAYAPLATLLQQAVAEPDRRRRLATLESAWLAEVARLQPALLPGQPGASDERTPDPFVAQSRFFEGVAQALKTLLAGGLPGLLIIDDVHHADGATLEWLSYVIRRLTLYRFCVLLTWRSSDVAAAHRLRQLAAECARQGNADLIALDRLAPAAIVRWVGQSVTRTGFDRERLAKRLYVESEGLPFFVAEYLNMLANDELPGLDAAWPAPGRVRDFLLARLAPLTEVARQVLAAAAAIGRSFDADTVMAAAGRSEDETLTALEELLARRTILESGAQQLDFSHAQLRQIVYGEISHLRRRLLHRRIGDVLATAARRTGAAETNAGETNAHVAGAGVLAYHYQLGGESARAAHFAFLAGEQARRLYANREAIGYFKQALTLGAPERCTLFTHLGDLHTLLGEYGQAEEAYTAALDCCRPAERAGLEHRLGRLRDRLGDAAGAARHLAAAHALLPADDMVAQAQTMIDWSLASVRTQNGPANELARRALVVAERAGDAATLARAYTLLALLARRSGDFAAALEAGEAGVAAARGQSDPGVLAAALNSLALVHADDNNPATAMQLVQEALAQVVRIGDRHREAALRNTLADLLHAGRETEQAMEQLKQAVVIFSEIGNEAGGENAEIWMLREW